nr:MAG TPA: hypothetical protein [Caudoviricetes sp.]
MVNTAIGRDLRLCGNAKCREKREVYVSILQTNIVGNNQEL